jgi:hypothetical protein
MPFRGIWFSNLTEADMPASPWRPDPLLKVLLVWTSLVGIMMWLPMVRGLVEGPAYQWAIADGIGGRGVGGAYWVLVVADAYLLAVLYLGWRGARQPFHWLLLLFHGGAAAIVLRAAVTNPESLFFEGATWGIRFSFARVGPATVAGIFMSALFWVVRDLRAHRPRSAPPWVWSRAIRVRAVLVAACVPVQVVLLRSSGPFGRAAMIGVVLTLWQWFVIANHLLRPVVEHRDGGAV